MDTSIRHNFRSWLDSMTPDSRPCKVGECPLMTAFPNLARNAAQATTLDPQLVGLFDRRAQHIEGAKGAARWGWHLMTVADMRLCLDVAEQEGE